jgi:membrane protein implicated in regulation of membrane protease activity
MHGLLALILPIAPTTILAWIGLVLAVAAVLVVFLVPTRNVRQKTLFSPAELAFLRVLAAARYAREELRARLAQTQGR